MNTFQRINEQDMELLPPAFQFTTAEEIPLAFSYGERTVRGIPTAFSPRVIDLKQTDSIKEYVIEGTDAQGLTVRAEYTEYKNYPVVEWMFYFTNNGKADTPILKNIRIEGEFTCPDAVLKHGTGDTRAEDGYHFLHDRVDREIILTPATGHPCQGAFPYMTLYGTDREIRLAIGWSAKWVAEFCPTAGGVMLSCGQDRCHTVLHCAETWRTPRLTLMTYTNENAPYRGINLWRRWYFDNIIPRENGEVLFPKMVGMLYGEGGKPEFVGATEKMQTQALLEFIRRDMKPDVWWIDAGWYPCEDWHETGSWYPDPVRFPDGMETLGRTCRENGVKFLLWFEPERVRIGSEIAERHPEWLLAGRKENGELYRKSYLFDLGNPEARAWLTDHVDAMIKRIGIGIYRQDFNFDPMLVWAQNETPDRIGMIENQHVQGYLAYWDALLERNPGLLIDSCASGGRRNDLETMRRAVPLHYTDVGYGNHPLKQLQYREMYEWLPYFRANNNSWDDLESGLYLEKKGHEMDEFAFYCALGPVFNVNNSKANVAIAAKMHKIWRTAAELELSGDYYPITECRASAEDWYATQFDDENKRCGFVLLIRNTRAEDACYLLKMPCVHEGKTYTLTNRENGEELTYTSEELARGVKIELPKRAGVIWFYTYR